MNGSACTCRRHAVSPTCPKHAANAVLQPVMRRRPAHLLVPLVWLLVTVFCVAVWASAALLVWWIFG